MSGQNIPQRIASHMFLRMHSALIFSNAANLIVFLGVNLDHAHAREILLDISADVT